MSVGPVQREQRANSQPHYPNYHAQCVGMTQESLDARTVEELREFASEPNSLDTGQPYACKAALCLVSL